MPDVNPYAFRTAVGGFHKGDVTAYITRTAAAHQAELAVLNKRLQALEQENAALRDQVHLLELPHKLGQLEQAPQESPEPPVPESATPEPTAPNSGFEQQELLAYRRAEAAERLACQRAKKLYGSIQTICDESAVSMDGAGSVAQEAMDIIAQQLQRVQDSLGAVQNNLRSSSESLRAMGDMVPDPAEGLEELL